MTDTSRPEISARAQIDRLLVAFYERALTDDLLGPVFRTAGLDLDLHLPRIGDFWERTLLGSGSYEGRPMAVHRHLNALVALSPEMFQRWLELWEEAVDSDFAGRTADQAKETARRVAVAIQQQLSVRDGLPIIAPDLAVARTDGGAP